MAKINTSFLPQSHRQTGQTLQAPEFYSTILKWGGGIETTNGKSGTCFLLLVIRSVSNVLRAQSRFVKFVCVCGGGGCSRTHESVLYITYILIKRNRPVCWWGGGGGVEAPGRTSYTFYKPTLGPKYVSNIPYNEFITPTTFYLADNRHIQWNTVTDFWRWVYRTCTLDSKYAVMWRQCCYAIGWSQLEAW